MTNVLNGIPLKYKGLPEDIAREIWSYEDSYFCNDLPIPFKGLNIYPVLMKDYNIFSAVIDCCTLNKNLDAKGITKTHLDYLCSLFEDNGPSGKLWLTKFTKLIELSFHVKNGLKCKKCGKVISYTEYQEKVIQNIEKLKKEKKQVDLNNLPPVACEECGGEEFSENILIRKDEKTKKYLVEIDGVKISCEDFNRLRQIIVFQNFPDYRDESWVHPQLRKEQEKRREILARQSGAGEANLEKKKIGVAVGLHYKLEDIDKLPIRKFLLLFSTMDDLIEYKIIKLGRMAGLVSSKDPMEHWLYKKEKSLYGEAVSLDSYVNKFKG